MYTCEEIDRWIDRWIGGWVDGWRDRGREMDELHKDGLCKSRHACILAFLHDQSNPSKASLLHDCRATDTGKRVERESEIVTGRVPASCFPRSRKKQIISQ